MGKDGVEHVGRDWEWGVSGGASLVRVEQETGRDMAGSEADSKVWQVVAERTRGATKGGRGSVSTCCLCLVYVEGQACVFQTELSALGASEKLTRLLSTLC